MHCIPICRWLMFCMWMAPKDVALSHCCPSLSCTCSCVIASTITRLFGASKRECLSQQRRNFASESHKIGKAGMSRHPNGSPTSVNKYCRCPSMTFEILDTSHYTFKISVIRRRLHGDIKACSGNTTCVKSAHTRLRATDPLSLLLPPNTKCLRTLPLELSCYEFGGGTGK